MYSDNRVHNPYIKWFLCFLIAYLSRAGVNQAIYTLARKPYMEASVGIGHIFNFFRINLVKRLTYLDNPNVSETGIRSRFKFDF